MAPFLVILLLLALGAGIVAWHTIGYPHTPAPRKPTPAKIPSEPDAPLATAAEPIYAPASSPFPATIPRTHDPFAHAPPLDLEQRS